MYLTFCNNFLKELQRIKTSIAKGKFTIQNDKIICKNNHTKEIVGRKLFCAFIQKDSHSFKESYGLKEFISHLEWQATILDALLIQAKVIVFIFNLFLIKYYQIRMHV